MAARVAVVLSGCGYLDGAEIQEAVLSLYFLDRAGAKVSCFAPERDQMHVVDHASGQVIEGQVRSVRQESARIARKEVAPLTSLDLSSFDALVIPGGFGVAKNLSDFATAGVSGSVHPELERVVGQAFQTQTPIAALCIAPAVVAMVLGKLNKSATLTIGQDPEVAKAIESCGVTHQSCQAGEIVVDAQAKLVSTPAYMLDSGLKDVGTGIESAIAQLLSWVG